MKAFVILLAMSVANAKKSDKKKSKTEIDDCAKRCPETIPDYKNAQSCEGLTLEGCMCTYSEVTDQTCYLICDVDETWTMTCLQQRFAPGDNFRPGDNNGRPGDNDGGPGGDNDDEKDSDKDELCVCPNMNPIGRDDMSDCDSSSWEECKLTCAYGNTSCRNSCVEDKWVEECVHRFEPLSTLTCSNGRCLLSEECQIPRDGYSITGQHISGMLGEYLLTPDGCTGTCTGCVLASDGRNKSVSIRYFMILASVSISLIIMSL